MPGKKSKKILKRRKSIFKNKGAVNNGAFYVVAILILLFFGSYVMIGGTIPSDVLKDNKNYVVIYTPVPGKEGKQLQLYTFKGATYTPTPPPPQIQPGDGGGLNPLLPTLYPIPPCTYYVAKNGSDGNPGTEASPWQTIGKAAATATAGNTVCVKEGTYSERVMLNKSGNNGNYITFISQPAKGAIIDGNGVNVGGWGGVVQIDNSASYIRVSGFKVLNSAHSAIMVSGGNPSNIIIDNNYVDNNFASGILVEKASAIVLDSNEVVGSHKAAPGTNNENVSLVTVNGFEVRNNVIHDTYNTESINAKVGSQNGKIHHNNIKPNMSAGIYLDAYDTDESNIEVFSNIIHDGSGGGIRGIAMAAEGGANLSKIKIYNNIVYNNGAFGIVVAYYRGCGGDPGTPCIMGNIDDVQIINNTVYNNDYASGWGGGIINEHPSSTGIVIRNNISFQNNKSDISPGTGVAENNLTSNPSFVNAAAGDLHLKAGSPAINKGSATGAPATDFDGKTRPQGGGFDIGAYEQ